MCLEQLFRLNFDAIFTHIFNLMRGCWSILANLHFVEEELMDQKVRQLQHRK